MSSRQTLSTFSSGGTADREPFYLERYRANDGIQTQHSVTKDPVSVTSDAKKLTLSLQSPVSSANSPFYLEKYPRYFRSRQGVTNTMASSVLREKKKGPANIVRDTRRRGEGDVTSDRAPGATQINSFRSGPRGNSANNKQGEMDVAGRQATSSVYSTEQASGVGRAEDGDQDGVEGNMSKQPATAAKQDDEIPGQPDKLKGLATAPQVHVKTYESSEKPSNSSDTYCLDSGTGDVGDPRLPLSPSYETRQLYVSQWACCASEVADEPFDDVSDEEEEEIGANTGGALEQPLLEGDTATNTPLNHLEQLASGGYSDIMENQPNGGFFKRDPLFQDMYKPSSPGNTGPNAATSKAVVGAASTRNIDGPGNLTPF